MGPPCNNGSAAVSKRMGGGRAGGQKIRLIIILSFYSHSFFLPFLLSFFLSFPIPHAFYGRRDFIARSNILLRVVIIFAASGGRERARASSPALPPLGVTASGPARLRTEPEVILASLHTHFTAREGGP